MFSPRPSFLLMTLSLLSQQAYADERIASAIPVIRKHNEVVAPSVSWEWGLVLLLVLVGLIWLNKSLRRVNPDRWGLGVLSKLSANKPAPVTIIDKQRLTAQTSLVACKWRSKEYLLVIHPQGVTVVDQAESSQPEEADCAEKTK